MVKLVQQNKGGAKFSIIPGKRRHAPPASYGTDGTTQAYFCAQAAWHKPGLCAVLVSIDSGEENSIILKVLDSGDVEVQYYLCNQLENIVYVSADNNGKLTYTVYDDKASKVDAGSVALNSVFTPVVSIQNTGATYSLRGYTYAGSIEYSPHQVGYGAGLWHYHSVDIYQNYSRTTYEYKTMNIGAGMAVPVAVGLIATAINVVFPVTGTIATQLLYAAALSTGATIAGGVVQMAISKTYYVQTDWYSVKVCDPESDVSKTYGGEIYYVALGDGTFSSAPTYSRYMAWDGGNTLALIFEDFWSCTYPGVRSITKA